MRERGLCWCWIGAVVLTGCAGSPPLDVHGVDRSYKVTDAAHAGQGAAGRHVLWGGLIVRSENQPQGTELEVLAYPLDSHQRPDTDSAAQSRFLVERADYLETADYAPGREITLVGTVQGIRTGKVDRYVYPFPVVTAEQLRLWPRPRERTGPDLHFGFGVGFGL